MDIPNTPMLVWQQVVASLRVLSDRTAQICLAIAFVMTVLSLAITPEPSPMVIQWIAVLAIGAVAMLGIVTWVASTSPAASAPDRQYRQTASVTLIVTALVFNAILSFWSTVFLGLGLFLIIRQSSRLRPGQFPWIMAAAIVTLIPWWVWTAVHRWDAGLVLLLPLAFLAWLSGAHLREGQAEQQPAEPHPSPRAHRFAAWMAMLLAGVMIVFVGLIGNSSNAWVALGGITMAFAVAAEAGAPSPGTMPGKYSNLISDVAFYFAAICWLVSIN